MTADLELKPAMTEAEVAFFRELLGNATSYVEFGCGGSTLLAVRTPSIRKIWSVEGDRLWIDKLRIVPELAAAIESHRLDLLYADIGPVGPFSRPTDKTTRDRWPAYQNVVFEDLGARNADLFLIDGRFRVACTLTTLLHCRPDAVIAVHDFSWRPKYQPILNFVERVSQCDTMAVFKPRDMSAADRATMMDALEAHRLQIS